MCGAHGGARPPTAVLSSLIWNRLVPSDSREILQVSGAIVADFTDLSTSSQLLTVCFVLRWIRKANKFTSQDWIATLCFSPFSLLYIVFIDSSAVKVLKLPLKFVVSFRNRGFVKMSVINPIVFNWTRTFPLSCNGSLFVKSLQALFNYFLITSVIVWG